jgi:D-glycero-alpha-D-manno-heptose-7-phosphate kinase
MIISKTPLRVSLAGGGSDFKTFYDQNEAAVVSTSIDLYVYLFMNKKFDDLIRFSYSQTETVSNPDEIKHKILKTVLKLYNLNKNIELATIADVPSSGSGLGSSSAFTICLLNALHAYLDIPISSKEELARKACEIEIGHCGEPIGKQDQYACAVGGFNFIEFKYNETVVVSKIDIKKKNIKILKENLLMFYTGVTRSANTILKDQNNSLKDKNQISVIKKMVEIAYDLKDELESGNLNAVGEYLHQSWNYKKSLNKNISNVMIEDIYNRGIKAGATGGKILGAGAGGFILFYAETKFHKNIINNLKPLRNIKFDFDEHGSQLMKV